MLSCFRFPTLEFGEFVGHLTQFFIILIAWSHVLVYGKNRVASITVFGTSLYMKKRKNRGLPLRAVGG